MKKGFKTITAITLSFAMGFGMLASVAPVATQAATITSAEKKAYQKYLKNGMGDDYFYSGGEEAFPLYGAQFALYDVNNDGQKDLIIQGALGLRTKTFTEVYIHAGNKYVTQILDGTLTGVSKKGIKLVDDDYEQAGAIRYHVVTIDKISAKGKVTTKLEKSVSTMFYDMSTNTEYTDGKVLTKTYQINGKNVAAKKYNSAMKKYSFSKVKWHEITDANIKKYIK